MVEDDSNGNWILQLELTNLVVSQCEASSSAGVGSMMGNITMNNCSFLANTAPATPGIFFATQTGNYPDIISIAGSVFADGIEVQSYINLMIEDCI